MLVNSPFTLAKLPCRDSLPAIHVSFQLSTIVFVFIGDLALIKQLFDPVLGFNGLTMDQLEWTIHSAGQSIALQTSLTEARLGLVSAEH